MTEVPDHLRKRAAEARTKAGGGLRDAIVDAAEHDPDIMDSDMITRAPWTPDQVAALNRWQIGPMHPFTCPSERHTIEVTFDPDDPGLKALKTALEAAVTEGVIEDQDINFDNGPRPGHALLIATADGWRCGVQECSYQQDWAHEFMARSEVLDNLEAQMRGLISKPG